MKIKFNILERFLIFDLFSFPNSYYNITVRIPGIKKKILFSELEIQNCDIKIENGMFSRDPEKEFEKEIEFDKKEFYLIHNLLRRIDKEYRFVEKYVPLYQKFVLNFKE